MMSKHLFILTFLGYIIFVSCTKDLLFSKISQPRKPRCPNPNEIYVENPPCDPQTCESIGKIYHCPMISSDSKNKVCRCKPGFYRNKNGECIPEKDCPRRCTKPNEILVENPPCDPQTCESIGTIYHCPMISSDSKNKVCRCKPGFYRNKNGECIPKEDCPPTCYKHEVYSNCTNGGCGPRTCDNLGYGIGCVKMDQKYCKEGCVCKEGYLRDKKGLCIPKEYCPECGGDPNAISGCGVNSGRHCSDIGQPGTFCVDICHADACDCRKGFYYDVNTQKCVRPEDCPPTCGKHEVYSNCTNGGCGPKTCDDLGYDIACVKIDPKYCKKGCVCQEGYVRDKKGRCIPKEYCPECAGDPNAITGCGVNCGRHCSDIGQPGTSCADICHVNACDCRKGFYYDDYTRKCVRPEDCLKCKKENEVVSPCANACIPRNCSQIGKPIPCDGKRLCRPGCVCKYGYLRTDDGNCVPKEKCPGQCPDGEKYDKCPDQLNVPLKCSELGFPLNCSDSDGPCTGKPGCICDKGNVRDKDGCCIPKDKCPSCGGDPNAITGCSNYCGNRCSDYKSKGSFCPLFCFTNGCQCRNGFVYDDNLKKCIKPEDCTPTCQENEVFSTCINSGCTPRNCSDIGQSSACVQPKECCSGCVCKQGYLRTDEGVCIPEEKCPEKQCLDDEKYVKCPDNLCFPLKCSELGFPLNCSSNSDGPCPGKPGCICYNGNVRDKHGNCIPKDECLSCGGDPNAITGCSNYCGNRCSDYKKKPFCPMFCLVNGCKCRDGFVYDDNLKKCVKLEDCTPTCQENEVFSTCINSGCTPRNCSDIGQSSACVQPKECCSGCVCKQGYLRTDEGVCVPKEQCPESQCPDNEKYDKCPDKLIIPLKCSELGFPLNSSDPDGPCPGNPGCICTSGNVRDKDGCCIPQDDCPSCGGDPNAISGCSNYCGQSCSDYKSKNPICALYCLVNGCKCRNGFVYDHNLKNCVRPGDCTPTCKANEVFSTCINGGCAPRKCSDIGKSFACVEPQECWSGCVCKHGYLRTDEGVCVPKEQCPESQCLNEEKYDKCPDNICFPLKCSELGFPLNCSSDPDGSCPGKPGCICDNGNVREKDGCCIPKEECPSCGGDPNAISGCGNCGRRCSDHNKNVICPRFCLFNGCRCRDGYLYDDNVKKCVKPKDCTPTCGVNEEFDTCTNGGCRKFNCSKPYVCKHPKICEPGCSCVKGYSRDANGTCIPEGECPLPTCGVNEKVDTCANGGCRKFKCSKPILCIDPIKCEVGCSCLAGYCRDENDCCIPDPEPQCDLNERLEKCPKQFCEPQKCSELGFLLDCNKSGAPENDTECGRPRCVCDYGYVRNRHGKCIPNKECPSCGGDTNAEAGCGINCGNRCSDYDDPSVLCLAICKFNGCDCKKGFVYDQNTEKCVRPKDCTPICRKNEEFSNCANDECLLQNCTQLLETAPCQKLDRESCCSGCVCKDGFLRDDEGKCIPKKECKEYCECGPNERYEEKPLNICEPLDCTEVGYELKCPSVDDPNCKDEPACICDHGLVRNETGQCVERCQCPSCGGDPNAVAGCGVNCGRTCSTYGKNPVCEDDCFINACDCKEGFVYDNIVEKCVRFKDCSKECFEPEFNITEAKIRLNLGNIAWTGELIYRFTQKNPGKNFVSSPSSSLLPMAQIGLFSYNTVLKQLLKALNARSKDDIRHVYSQDISSFKNQKNAVFDVATKYYVNDQYELSDSFVKQSKKYFDAGGENINFGDSEQAVTTINDWVAKKTHDRIQNLLSKDSVGEKTVIVSVNAIYYMGDWVHQFDIKNTKKCDFTKRNNEIIQLDTMYQENYFKYAETSVHNIKIQALELPYKNGNFSCFIILPEAGCFDDTVSALRNPDNFIYIRQRLENQKVRVSLPKMKINTQIDLVEYFQEYNVTAMFDTRCNDFKGMLKRDVPLHVSAVIQKAFVEVNEKGTEAAAATAIVIGVAAAMATPTPVFTFNANHPFIFYILYRGVPLFAGTCLGVQ